MKVSYLFAIFILILSGVVELAMYRIITKLEKLVHDLEERVEEESNA